MIKEAIAKASAGNNLNLKITKQVFSDIFNGKASDAQIAALLIALATKGVVQSEIQGAASVIRQKAKKITLKPNLRQQIIDTCGTGGSEVDKFNVSSTVAFVVAASGAIVAKHGNKAMSSNCGSADVLLELGINITASQAKMRKALEKIGIAFLYAPLYHPALARVAVIRRELGLRTIFNILGPLCNPASANYQLLGVYDPLLLTTMAQVLKGLGAKRALVVNSSDLGDEISLSCDTKAVFLNQGKITNLTLKPNSFGLKKIKINDILVKDAKSSANMVKAVLKGEKGPGRDLVLANAGSCLYILGKAKSLKAGVVQAAELIDSGRAFDKLVCLKDFLKG